jgi:hypothetical protein
LNDKRMVTSGDDTVGVDEQQSPEQLAKGADKGVDKENGQKPASSKWTSQAPKARWYDDHFGFEAMVREAIDNEIPKFLLRSGNDEVEDEADGSEDNRVLRLLQRQ